MERHQVPHARKIAFAGSLPLLCAAWALLAVQFPLRDQELWLIWLASVPAAIVAYLFGRHARTLLLDRWSESS